MNATHATHATRTGPAAIVVAACALLVPAPLDAQSILPDPAAIDAAPATATRGNVGAVLEVVEFSDFECPYCGEARVVLETLFARHGDEVRIVYRHYPLPSHDYAERAAQASVEAARQHAFWPYHDLLFRHQDRLTDVDLVGYADSLGLDSDRFVRALEGEIHAETVLADVVLGRELAVTGTPTFFLNGYRIVGVPPLWVFEEALRAFREGRVEPKPLVLPRAR